MINNEGFSVMQAVSMEFLRTAKGCNGPDRIKMKMSGMSNKIFEK
jgi:hypothetical protein